MRNGCIWLCSTSKTALKGFQVHPAIITNHTNEAEGAATLRAAAAN